MRLWQHLGWVAPKDDALGEALLGEGQALREFVRTPFVHVLSAASSPAAKNLRSFLRLAGGMQVLHNGVLAGEGAAAEVVRVVNGLGQRGWVGQEDARGAVRECEKEQKEREEGRCKIGTLVAILGRGHVHQRLHRS